MKRLCIVAMFALCSCVVVNESYAGWFGPSNYDECILDSMNNVDSDAAARLVAQSCRKKFPINKNSNNVETLSDEVVSKIESSATFWSQTEAILLKREWTPRSMDYFDGDVFNNNEDWYIVGLVIRITNKDNDKYRDYDVALNNNAGVAATPPLSKGKFYFEACSETKNWSWNIVKARGYKK